MKEIPNSELSETHLPNSGADWGSVGRFALSFNGYDHHGSFGACAAIANSAAAAWNERQALPPSDWPSNMSLL